MSQDEIFIYAFMFLGGVFLVVHNVSSWLWKRKLPCPSGNPGEVIRTYRGRHLRIVRKRLSAVDKRLIGYTAVDDYGETFVLPVELGRCGYRVVR